MSNSSPNNSNPSYNGTSANSNDSEIVSIVPQFSQTDEATLYDQDEAYAIFELSDSSDHRPQWIESLLTPWGVGAMFLILLANSLLSWAKWLEPAPTQTNTPTPSINSSNASPTPVEKMTNLSLNSLSTTPQPKTVKNTIPVPSQPQKVSIPKPPAQPVTVKPKTDLTSALLPPSIQPQFIPVQNIPQPPAPAPLPPAPSTVVQIPPSPAPNTVDPATMRTVNERTLEEMRLQEDARRNMPFIEKAKAQKQAIQTRQNLNQVLDNIEQQQQKPVIPNTLVIDGRNPENNTNR